MGKSRIFFPWSALDGWLSIDEAAIEGQHLVLRPSGARLYLTEAFHVIGEVDAGLDGQELVGTVLEVAEAIASGGELLESSLVLGDVAYEIQHGFLCSPIDTGGAPQDMDALLATLSSLCEPREKPSSDAELLAQYLMEKLD